MTRSANPQNRPAIVRLVEYAGGPVALSRLLGGEPPYQSIQQWVRRGWASPMHLFRLQPHLPRGMRVEHLAEDRQRAKAAA